VVYTLDYYGEGFKTVSMKPSPRVSLSIVLLSLTFGLGPSTLAAPPSGTIISRCSPVWDVSGEYPVSVTVGDEMNVSFGIAVQQDARGKLSGGGTTTVDIDGEMVQGDYTVAGKVSSTHDGVDSSVSSVTRAIVTVRVSGSGVIGGVTRRFSMLVTYKLQIDPATLTAFGTGKGHASATGLGTGRINEAASVALPPGMNGVGDLEADLVLTGNKFSGTATLTLSNGRTVEFNVAGSYAPKTDKTKLKMTGTGASKGTNFRWTGEGEQMASGVLAGKILGQSTRIPE
jgi:hypothetical protein